MTAQPPICPRGCTTPAHCLERFTGREYANCQLRAQDPAVPHDAWLASQGIAPDGTDGEPYS